MTSAWVKAIESVKAMNMMVIDLSYSTALVSSQLAVMLCSYVIVKPSMYSFPTPLFIDHIDSALIQLYFG